MKTRNLGERIARHLVGNGLLPESRLQELLEEQKRSGQSLTRLLSERGGVAELDLMLAVARCLEVPPVNLSRIRVSPELLALVPRDFARANRVAPVARVGKRLFVAMVDPLNVVALDELRQITQLDAVPMIATEQAVRDAWEGVVSAKASMEEAMRAAGDVLAVETGPQPATASRRDDLDLDSAQNTGSDAPVVRIVNLILGQALKEKASDIHLEPFEDRLKLRYRVDGNLVEASSPPKALQLPIASRIKILAGLDISERRLPQDGRFRMRVTGREVDLRVSILPTVFGEKIVIRLLDRASLSGSIDQLGMDAATLSVFRRAVDAPHGMILMTGPTGSGKTTTLYSVLKELNHPEYNIVTVEDPVEYQLAGVNQVAANPGIGLGFADALRSILRQDPDIVMIGEIRDRETADIAVKAALTGHQVLSTLHTNDAAGAMTRLDDMGIEPFLIASSVILACAQRLVRRVCPNCREEITPGSELREKLGLLPEDGSVFFHGTGCARCKGTGYAGRAAILEVLPVTEEIRRLIIQRASSAVIKEAAVHGGMRTLRRAGLDKAAQGVTSLEEVLRITSEDH